mgnify:CR=1 FL=1
MFKRVALLAIAFAVLAEPASAQSRWRFQRLTEPMTDQVRGVASIKAARYTLVVKCDFDGEVYVDLFDEAAALYGLSSRPRKHEAIMQRFGNGDPISQDWRGGSGAYLLLGDVAVTSFVRSLMSSDRLALRIPETFGRPTDVTFPLAGSSAAISSVYRACGKIVPGTNG